MFWIINIIMKDSGLLLHTETVSTMDRACWDLLFSFRTISVGNLLRNTVCSIIQYLIPYPANVFRRWTLVQPLSDVIKSWQDMTNEPTYFGHCGCITFCSPKAANAKGQEY